MAKRAFLTTAAIILAGVLSAGTAGAATGPVPPAATSTAVPMQKDGGVFVVTVTANGVASFTCIVDSGASDVNIPDSVFQKLRRAGTITQADYIGTQEYTLADGSTSRGRTYRIKSLKVGNITVHNVVASIGGDESSGLLGQSFLERFRSWSLNNSDHTLVLTGLPSTPAAAAGPANHGVVTGPHPADGPTSVAQGGPKPAHAPHGPSAPPAAPASSPSGATVAQVGPSHDQGDRDPSQDDQLTAQHSVHRNTD